MASESRTAKSIRNSSVALIMYFINLVLQFYSRKIFLEYLGTEILGLNTTATNLLQFLNLAELGIGSAIACTLYKPLFDNDRQAINEIISLQGKLYKRIATFLILGSLVIMCFFPIIFHKMDLPMWYAYASYSVLLFSSLFGYFANYKQIILTADLKDYKIQLSYKLMMAVKVLVQIVVLMKAQNPYIWWLILETIFTVLGAIALNITIHRSYPFLKSVDDSYSVLKGKYPEIIQKIKQLFVHKISGFVVLQSTPIVIYSLQTLSLVALYGNYTIITTGIISLLAAIFNSMLAGIGNLVAEGNKDRIMTVFYELFSLRFFVVSVLCFCTFMCCQPFIVLWIGSEYLLPKSTLLIMVFILYFYLLRYLVYDYVSAYGFFDDVWAAIIEVIINLSLSIGLGYCWGLNGILSGVLISIILMSILWKPYYLFKKKLNIKISGFYRNYLKHLLIGVIACGLSYWIVQLIPIIPNHGILSFVEYTIISGCVFSLILFGLMIIARTPIDGVLKRIKILSQ